MTKSDKESQELRLLKSIFPPRLSDRCRYLRERTELPKFRFSLAWLLMLTIVCASLSLHVANFWFKPPRPDSRFPAIDGESTQGRFVDLATGDRLFLRFGLWDGGAEIERAKNGETVWLEYVDALGARRHLEVTMMLLYKLTIGRKLARLKSLAMVQRDLLPR